MNSASWRCLPLLALFVDSPTLREEGKVRQGLQQEGQRLHVEHSLYGCLYLLQEGPQGYLPRTIVVVARQKSRNDRRLPLWIASSLRVVQVSNAPAIRPGILTLRGRGFIISNTSRRLSTWAV